MKSRFILLVLLISVFFTTNGQTIDRKGFYLSFGIGPGITNYKLDGSFIKPDGATIYYGSSWLGDIYSDNITGDLEEFPFTRTSFNLATNFNLGYGLTNQLIVSYMNRVSFILDDILHGENYIYHYVNPPALTFAGITGVEFDYYFTENIKSPYVSFGSGISILNQPGVDDYLTQTGFGLSFGGGYQFTKRICIDLNILYLKGNLQNKIKNEIEALVDGITIDKSFHTTSINLALKYLLF
jgi:opacity protein-like surface antigen